MVLTENQLQALAKGVPVAIKIDDQDCVVVQQEVFDRMKDAAADASDLAPRDAYATVLNAIDKDDEAPDQYLKYLKD